MTQKHVKWGGRAPPPRTPPSTGSPPSATDFGVWPLGPQPAERGVFGHNKEGVCGARGTVTNLAQPLVPAGAYEGGGFEEGPEITVTGATRLKSKHTIPPPYTKIATSSNLASGLCAYHPQHRSPRRRHEKGRRSASG